VNGCVSHIGTVTDLLIISENKGIVISINSSNDSDNEKNKFEFLTDKD
jgi:hypothetical protein